MLHRFYFITDRKKFKKPFLDTIKEVLDKGIRLLQIREKDLPDNELFKLTEDVLKIAEDYDVKIIINSRLDVALLLNLDGVRGMRIQAYKWSRSFLFLDFPRRQSTTNLEKLREIVNKLPFRVVLRL